MMITEQPAVKSQVDAPVRTIIGAINLAVILIFLGAMISAFMQIVYFENPMKAIGLIAFAIGMKYLFIIKKIQ